MTFAFYLFVVDDMPISTVPHESTVDFA